MRTVFLSVLVVVVLVGSPVVAQEGVVVPPGLARLGPSPIDPDRLPGRLYIRFSDSGRTKALRLSALGFMSWGIAYDAFQGSRPTQDGYDWSIMAAQVAFFGGAGVLGWNAASDFRVRHPRLTPWLQVAVAGAQVAYGANRAKWGRRWDRLRDAQERGR